MNIYKIVFTGGPCAGKTEVINFVKDKLTSDGYHVVIVKETAAELITSGIIPNEDRNHTLMFQNLVFETQSRKEKVAEDYCEYIKNSNLDYIKDKKGIIIFYDRGLIDNRAYLSHNDYNNLLKNFNCNEIKTIDNYDLVINLISLATTNPELYCLDGVRYETIEEASIKDKLTSAAWLLHRNLKVIKPTENFEDKILCVLNTIYDLLNNKINNDFNEYEINKDKTDFTYFNNDNSRKLNIKTYYFLINNNTQIKVKERSYNNCVSYILEKEVVTSTGLKKIVTKPITDKTFNYLKNNKMLKKVKEENILNFIDSGNYFSIIEEDDCVKLRTLGESVLLKPDNIVLKKQKTFIK